MPLEEHGRDPLSDSNAVSECNKLGSKSRKTSSLAAKSAAASAYDDDGVRIVWDSSPPSEVRAERERWRAVSLRDKVGACSLDCMLQADQTSGLVLEF